MESDTSFDRFRRLYMMRYQQLLDRSTRLIMPRWIAWSIVVLLYIIRVWWIQGFYIISYALGIYNLNLVLGFITPQFNPETEDGPELPTKADEEFKPFVRRLPEFKFWYSSFKSFVIGFMLTMTRLVDIPVYWPILLCYWCVLVFITMRRQIKHMIKYKYVPFSTGKKIYAGKARKDVK